VTNITGLYGRVIDSGGSLVQGVNVRFYDKAGANLGSTVTDANGAYQIALSPQVVYFTIDIAGTTTPGNYFQQYTYNFADYIDADTSCLAKAPTFSTGEAIQVSDLILTLRWMGPPPPPNGCLGG
jgi:hypothetical protein